MVVLSTRRLDDLGPVDAGALQVTAGAGVTLAHWREHARAAGLDAPLDFASRDSATIGGAIATNAGGSRVVRFGTMRAQVAGITAVLADGSQIGSLAGLPKETVGVHWPSLAGRERGHAGGGHGGPAAARAVVPAHGDGDGRDGRRSTTPSPSSPPCAPTCRTSTPSS